MSSLPRWNLRLLIPFGLAALLCASLAFSAGGQTKAPILKLPARTTAVATRNLSASARLQEFSRVLAERRVAQADRAKFSGDFQKLPAALQAAVLQRTSPRLAKGAMLTGKYLVPVRVGAILAKMTPKITSCLPEEGEAGRWCAALGSALNTKCAGVLDGAKLSSFYLNMPPAIPSSVWFLVPASTTKGTMHSLVLRNEANGLSSATKSYKVVAPRGYRGYYGWHFRNFGDPTIPWAMYRDYFGAAAVQYPDGTHRPAAQAYYNDHYKGVGGGGNCFGMSVASLRFRNGLSMGYWNHWFHTAPYNFAYAWWYPATASLGTARAENHQTVQEYQGSWLSEEVLNAHAVTQTQGARGCFNRVASFMSSAHKCVLVLWGHGLGHAIVPYETHVAGDDHQMICYDNNYPYTETESNPDPTIAHVAWGANTFSDPTESWATWAECMSYAEVTPATPHLPGSEYGGPGSAVVAAAMPGTRVTQITDQAGHRFFNADGTPNMNPATRIPNSAIVYPLVAPLTLERMRLGSPRPMAQAQPTLFVFSQAGGKSLTFQVGGPAAQRTFQHYAPGISYEVQMGGAGQIRAVDLLRNSRSLELVNSAALRPSAINVIHSAAAGDRVFQMRNITGLGAQAMFLRPLMDGSKLNIQGPAGLRFNLSLIGPLGRGHRSLAFTGLSMTTPRMSVGLDNWAARVSNLNLQHLNAAGGLQQQLHLTPR